MAIEILESFVLDGASNTVAITDLKSGDSFIVTYWWGTYDEGRQLTVTLDPGGDAVIGEYLTSFVGYPDRLGETGWGWVSIVPVQSVITGNYNVSFLPSGSATQYELWHVIHIRGGETRTGHAAGYAYNNNDANIPHCYPDHCYNMPLQVSLPAGVSSAMTVFMDGSACTGSYDVVRPDPATVTITANTAVVASFLDSYDMAPDEPWYYNLYVTQPYTSVNAPSYEIHPKVLPDYGIMPGCVALSGVIVYENSGDPIPENTGPVVDGPLPDGNNNGSTGPALVPSIKVPVTVKDNAARLVVILVSGIAYNESNSVENVICNGIYLTKAGSKLDSDGVTFVEAWYTVSVPVQGEYTAIVTFAGSVRSAVVGALTFYGMDGGTPVYGWMSNAGVGAAHSLEYDLTDYRLIVDVLAVQGIEGVHVNPLVTTQIPFYVTPGGTGPLQYGAAAYKNNSKSGAMYWLSETGTAPRRYSHGILVLNRHLYTDVEPTPMDRDNPANPTIPYEPPPDGSDDPRNPDIEPPNVQGCIVSHNSFLACTGTGVQSLWVDQLVITGNTISTMGGDAIHVQYTVNTEISDNFLLGNQGCGIYAYSILYGMIRNNFIQDCALDNTKTPFFQVYINWCDDLTILSNRISEEYIIHDYAIHFSQMCERVVVMNNDLTDGFLISKFEDFGLNVYKENNAPEEPFSERVQDVIGNTTVTSGTIEMQYDDIANNLRYVVIPGTVDAGTLDGLDSTAFALALHSHLLTDLTDVDTTTIGTDYILIWDAVAEVWKSGELSIANKVLWDLLNVADITPTNGQALIWDDINHMWVPGTIVTGAIVLADLTDVDSTVPTDGQALVWSVLNNTWGPGTVAAGGPTGIAAFAGTIGDGVAVVYNVNHALNTTDVIVQVFEAASGRYLAYPAVQVIDANNIEVEFTVAPALDAYRVVVTAAGAGGGVHRHNLVCTFDFQPEYPGAIFVPQTVGNGTLVPLDDTVNRRNAYRWTTDQVTAQQADIIIRFRLPPSYSTMGAALVVASRVSDISGNTAVQLVEFLDNSGTNVIVTSVVKSLTWVETSYTISGGTFAPGDRLTIRARLIADINDTADLGGIYLPYVVTGEQ